MVRASLLSGATGKSSQWSEGSVRDLDGTPLLASGADEGGKKVRQTLILCVATR